MKLPGAGGISASRPAVLLAAAGLAVLMTASAATPAADQPVPDQPVPDQEDRFACGALKALDFSEAAGAAVTLTDVETLPAAGDQPEVCRVGGTIAPQVGFEVRLPSHAWNGKLLVTGCSNLCGVLQVQGMEDALARGYAAATTDMGHRTGDWSDARWAWNNPQLEADFGHRATHVTTLAAKEIVASYYGDKPGYSYFRGCSTGGRQALVAAERYPDDYNGIIAGAPFNQLLSVPHMAWVLAANTGPDRRPILQRAEFELLGKAVLAACDTGDGLADGVIGDPQNCRFEPRSLLCPAEAAGDRKGASAAGACLTAPQVAAAEKIYAGPRDSEGRPWSSGGSPLGSEFMWDKLLIAQPTPTPLGRMPFYEFIVRNWSRYLAYEPDPPLPAVSGAAPARFDFDTGREQLAATVAVTGFRPDLERFRALGGRLLVYHGWVDESLMPAHTLDYWREAARRIGGSARLAEFARLYMVPGMLHCGGGPGAADIDYLSALEAWVEKGQAPGALRAYKVHDAVPNLVRQPRFPPVPGSIEFERPVYPYPGVAVYDGAGDPRSAASFKRRLPAP